MLAACQDSAGPGASGPVAMSFVARGEVATGSALGVTATSSGTLVVSGRDTLRLTSARLVIDEVELSRGSSTSCLDDGDYTVEVTSECAELEVGPFLVDLPLTGSVASPITVSLPAGSYRKLEMKLRRADPGDDRAFDARYPEMRGITVQVAGTYRGQPFSWRGDVESQLELYFPSAMTVGGGDNFTVNIDVGRWFRDDSGAIIDPASAGAGQPGFATVAQNIGASFGVYEDDDRDGRDDHGGRRDR
jgi:hypothetical protein